MEQFASSVNEFLAFRRYDILPDKGRISAAAAKKKAEAEEEAARAVFEMLLESLS